MAQNHLTSYLLFFMNAVNCLKICKSLWQLFILQPLLCKAQIAQNL